MPSWLEQLCNTKLIYTVVFFSTYNLPINICQKAWLIKIIDMYNFVI